MSTTDKRWWLQEEPCQALYKTVTRLMRDDTRRNKYAKLRELVDDDDDCSVGEEWATEGRTRDNLMANGCETIHGKITESYPRPYFLTVGGDWEAAERAELMTRWMDGEFERMQLDDLYSEVVMEAIKVGHGAALFYKDQATGRPAAELVFAEDIYVDKREAYFRKVRTMYRVAAIDREVLMESYPEHRKAIEACDVWNVEQTGGALPDFGEETTDMLLVIEAWRLPVRKHDEPLKKGKDRTGRGRHVIVIADTVLWDEEWRETFFPIVEFPWVKSSRKHFGLGLAQRLVGSQVECDHLSDKLYESANLSNTFLVVAGEMNIEQLNNGPMTVLKVQSVSDVVPLTTEPVGPILLQIIRERMALTYSSNGISEMDATSEVPAQFTSGKAITTYSDVKTKRFAPQARRGEWWRCESAKRIVAIMERTVESAEDGDDDANEDALETLGGDKHSLEVVKYTDARLDDIPYVIRIFPVSKLSTTPSARMQEVELLMQAGLITDPDDARELMDLPDLDRYNDLRSAERDDVRDALQQCKRGKQAKAHSFMNTSYAIKLGQQLYSLWHRKGAPDKVLTELQNFIHMCASIEQEKARVAAEAAAVGQPPPPPGGAAPPPPTDVPPMPPGGEPMPMPPEMMPPMPLPGAA